jgi:hypothetical protein
LADEPSFIPGRFLRHEETVGFHDTAPWDGVALTLPPLAPFDPKRTLDAFTEAGYRFESCLLRQPIWTAAGII